VVREVSPGITLAHPRRIPGVQGSGFRVQGLGFGVQGSGFGVWGLKFKAQGSGFRIAVEG
jgi:hypothetical protein